MLTERDGVQIKLHCITIEDLVPEGHFLRKVEKAVDFSFIYNEVRNLYCPDNGRPGIDPVILVKYLLDKYMKRKSVSGWRQQGLSNRSVRGV